MRKIFITLVMSLFVASSYAQSEAALKALDKAKSETQNPKKASNPASWVKLGTAYTECFDVPISGVWQGASQMEVHLMLKGQQVLSTNTVEAAGRTFNVESYNDKDLYFDENGTLVAWDVKKPVLDEDMLVLSYDAFNKAYELDEKGSQAKVIAESLKGIQNRYVNEGMSFYTRGDNAEASEMFGKSVEIASHPLINIVDSVMIYYTAVTASLAGDDARAIEYLTKCIEIGYDENGDVYAALAENYKKGKDTVKAMELLNAGFAKYPVNQGILVALINMYMETGDEPTKLFELLKTAQENEPENASLYYAEGNV